MPCIVEGKGQVLLENIKGSLEKYGYVIVRNFFDKAIIKKKINILKQDFNLSKDIRISGHNRYNMPNYQRLDLGDYAQVNARFCRMFTQFSWNQDSLFYDEIEKLIRLRNDCLGLSRNKDLTYTTSDGRLCDLPKILHYPIGGAFMNKHFDHYNNDGIMNVLLSLSKRGIEFDKGGVYYYDNNGNFIDAEALLEIGDIYMHLPTTIHGVHAVDSHKNIDLETLSGRCCINLSCETFQFEN